jgi:NADH:ubiquinone reductase (H+-translocating)
MIAEPCSVCVEEKLRRVVILGVGFGGLSAAQALKRAAVVTVSDHRNFHLFQPLLYQVATGSLSLGEIVALCEVC